MALRVTETGYDRASAVTPHDSNNHPFQFNSLYVGGAGGTVTIVTIGGDVVQFQGVPIGTIIPVRGTRVNAAGTAATLIVALG